MVARIKQFLTPPVFEDENKSRTANLLNIILISLIMLSVIVGGVLISLFPSNDIRVIIFFALIVLLLGAYGLTRFYYIQVASILVVLALWGTFTVALFQLGGVRTPAFSVYIMITLIAGMLLGERIGVGVAFLSILTGAILLYAEYNGFIIFDSENILPVGAFVIHTFILSITVMLMRLYIGQINNELLEATRRNEHELAKRNYELQVVQNSLEEQVTARTQNFEISAEISRQLTEFLDVNELLKYVVDRVHNEFKFYHTHIYLVDEETGDLILTEGYGDVGRRLKEKGHQLEAGQGIVGTVAVTNKHFLSNNVDETPNFFRNPLLQKTNSELAVPLRKGAEVLGVLDIQSEKIDRFSPVDLSLIQSIGDQTAVAIHNARLLTQTQEALHQVQYLNSRLTRENWEDFQKTVPATGYRFKDGKSFPITSNKDTWFPPMKQAMAKKQLIKHVETNNNNSQASELAVPLMLRGQVIGVLDVKRQEKVGWAEEELSAIEVVADQVSRALENSRLAREQERTIEQLKEIDRLKSEFLTSMSHELRTPLNSIIGFADVLLQGIDGDLPDMAISDIKLIHNSGQHLLALINDILDLSKIEAGKMELVREPLDVTEAVSDVLAASNSLVKDKPVEILVEKPDELPLVYADKLRLSQILLNLVSNAAKFTHEGSITIKANVDEENPGRMRIAIVDTGIGIPEEKQQTIFDRFRQADGTTTRQYGGTGLGLAITLNLTDMHGGELKVKSEVDVGSEFYFTIPLADSITEQVETEIPQDETLV